VTPASGCIRAFAHDQVATDIRLYLRDAIDRILAGIKAARPRWSIWPNSMLTP